MWEAGKVWMFLIQGHNIVTSSPHTFYSSPGTQRPPLTDTPGTSAHQEIQNLAHFRNWKVAWINNDVLKEQKGSKNPQLHQCPDHDPLEEDDTPAGGVGCWFHSTAVSPECQTNRQDETPTVCLKYEVKMSRLNWTTQACHGAHYLFITDFLPA